jgi:hypothetical protein
LWAFKIIAFAAGYGPAASFQKRKSESGGSEVKQELDMDTCPNYLSLTADMRSQQIARLMRGVQPKAFADEVNRLERSVQ